MSKTIGLTPAMRKALESPYTVREFTLKRALDAGFLKYEPYITNGLPAAKIVRTPRGHAARAAPKMTQREYATLERAERGEYINPCMTRWQLQARGFLFDGKINPSGRKALNDVRAAIGSADYKETT